MVEDEPAGVLVVDIAVAASYFILMPLVITNILDTLTSKLDAFLEVLRVEALEQPCDELDTAIGICEYIQTDPANAPNSTAVKVLAAVNAVGGLNKDIHKATKEIVTMCLCRDIDPKSQGAFNQQLHNVYKGGGNR